MTTTTEARTKALRNAATDIQIAAHVIFSDAVELYANATAAFQLLHGKDHDDARAQAEDIADAACDLANHCEEQVAKLRAAAAEIDNAARADEREGEEGGAA